MSAWGEYLICNIEKIVATSDHRIDIFLPEYNSPNFAGARKIAEAISPTIDVIVVWSDQKLKALYRKEGKKWISFDTKPIPLKPPEPPKTPRGLLCKIAI